MKLFLSSCVPLMIAASAFAQTTKPAQLDFGMDGLSIPPAQVVNGHTARSAELLGEAYRRHDPVVFKRVQYVADMGKVALPTASPFLIDAMNDAAPEVRAQAARSAAMVGEPALASGVEQLLSDPDPLVRREAILAASNLSQRHNTPTKAIERGLVDTDPTVTAAAIESAWTPDHAARIAQALNNLPASLKPDAAAALGRLKAKDQSAVLLPLLKGEIGERAAAVKALGEVGDTAQTNDVLAMLTDPHPTVRREAIIAVGKLADATTREARAIAMLADADRTVRETAATVLTPVPSVAAIEPLTAQLAEDYAPLHQAVRVALAHPANETVKKTTIDWAAKVLGDARRGLGADCSYVLGSLRSDVASDRHVALLDVDPKSPTTDWPTVAQAAESLGLIRQANAAPLLMKLVSQSPGDSTKLAPPQRDAMQQAMANAVVALARLQHQPALAQARRILKLDPVVCPFQLRAAAAYAMGVLPDPQNATSEIKTLFAIYDGQYENRFTKFEALKALGNIGNASAVGRLKSIGETETFPDLRYVAHWSADRCGQTTTPYRPPVERREPPISITNLP